VFNGHTGRVWSVTYSPDGRQIASGSEGGTVWIWDLDSGESHVLEGHTGRIRSIAYSPDGKQIASGAYDRTVRIWDLKTYQEVQKYLIIPHINLSGANFELSFLTDEDRNKLKMAGAIV
jgi:WD40 repeat protein